MKNVRFDVVAKSHKNSNQLHVSLLWLSHWWYSQSFNTNRQRHQHFYYTHETKQRGKTHEHNVNQCMQLIVKFVSCQFFFLLLVLSEKSILCVQRHAFRFVLKSYQIIFQIFILLLLFFVSLKLFSLMNLTQGNAFWPEINKSYAHTELQCVLLWANNCFVMKFCVFTLVGCYNSWNVTQRT